MNQRTTTKLIIASCLITSSLWPTIFAPEPAKAKPANNKIINRAPFYSQNGRFSIDFPSEPTASTDEVEGDITVYSFIVADGKTFYQVGYYDVPDLTYLSREGIRKLTVKLPREFAQGFEAKITSTKGIQIGNHPGQEFKFTQSGQSGQGRAYIVKERVYLIAGMDTPKASQAFLNSFRLR